MPNSCCRNKVDLADRDVYYWYYATQVLHHLEGDYWEKWNRVMRQALPEDQIHGGKEEGSWDPDGDRWGNYGGRLYTTCLSTYMLEVYYRHLPIYAYRMRVARSEIREIPLTQRFVGGDRHGIR